MPSSSAATRTEQPSLFARNVKFMLDENNWSIDEANRLSQARLARLLDMDPTTFSRYLSGQSKPFDDRNYSKASQLILQKNCRSLVDLARLHELVPMDAFSPDVLGTIDIDDAWNKWMPQMYQKAKERSFKYNSIPVEKRIFAAIWDHYEASPDLFLQQLQVVCSAGQFESAMRNEDLQLKNINMFKLLISENEHLKEENERLRNNVELVVEESEKRKKEIGSLTDETKRYKLVIGAIEEESQKNKIDIVSLKNENERYKIDINLLTDESERHKKQSELLSNESERYKKQSEFLLNESERHKKQSELLSNESERYKSIINSLEVDVMQYKSDIVSLTDENERLRIDNDRVSGGADKLADELKQKDNVIQKNKGKTRRFMILTIGLAVCLAISLFALWRLYIFDIPESQVTLTVKYCSPIGDRGGFVTGNVTVSRGSPDDYAVTMALISPENGNIYGPKPTKDTPVVPVTLTDNPRVGNFTCVFSSGNSADSMAEMLYVYVVKNDFIPNEDVSRTQRTAIASVEIDRSK